MKSTKNVLMTGVALAIALFASVQMTAMERQVNPHLGGFERILLEVEIDTEKNWLDPKKGLSPRHLELSKQKIKQLEDMYYGDQAYTVADINNVVNR